MINPRNIFLLLLLATAFLIGYFGALPAWNTIGERSSMLAQAEARLRVAEGDLAHNKKLIEFYSALSFEDRNRVVQALPEDTDLPNLLVNIDRIAKESGVVLSNVSIKKQQAPTGFAREAEPLGPPSANLSFNARGGYTSTKEFLRSVERFLRLIDIDTILLASRADGAGGREPLLDITLTAKTYELEDTF